MIIAGSEVTSRLARYSASRVALPAMNCAVTAAAQSMAVVTAARCDAETFIPLDGGAELILPSERSGRLGHSALTPELSGGARRVQSLHVLDRSRPNQGLSRIAAALTYRDFRVLWTGAFTSSIGTWMQKVAQSWLVLTIAGPSSAFFLGLDSFLGEAPILLFTLVGGVVADRRDRRQLLLMSQYVQMTTAFTLAALVYWDVVRIWHVLTLSVITGMAQAFGGPAHQSLVPSLVDKEHLPNAIALNSIQFNLARVIGPLIAGAALAAFGMAACFGLNGVSFLAVIVALLSLHITPHARRRTAAGCTRSCAAGCRT